MGSRSGAGGVDGGGKRASWRLRGGIGRHLGAKTSRFLAFRASANADRGTACPGRRRSACGQGGERDGPPGSRR